LNRLIQGIFGLSAPVSAGLCAFSRRFLRADNRRALAGAAALSDDRRRKPRIAGCLPLSKAVIAACTLPPKP
jgi:hypothetical protein